jgi:TPR repeat protein
MAEQGLGGTKDLGLARKYYALAAASGVEEAVADLRRLEKGEEAPEIGLVGRKKPIMH